MSLERARPLPLVQDMSHAGNLGLDEARLERVRAYVDDQVHNLNRAPFMQVRILRTGGIRGTGKEEASTAVAFTHSAGHIAPAPAPLADPDTLIRIYSMTKPIVSVAAMILVERAQLHLDHPVERYLPCFQDMEVFISPGVTRPATTKMTVQHLLTHSSGLTYNFFPGPVAEMYKEHGIEFLQSDIGTVDLPADAEKPGALLDMVEKLAALPLKCDPGTEFNYSFSTDVMGCLIEQVTGKRLPEFLREEIFVPLGMADTGFHVPPEKIARFAACYNLKASGSGFELTDAPAESSFLTPHLHLTSGGGGLISSLNDYSTFVSMLLGKGQANGARILSRKTVEYMMINHLEPGVLVPAGFLHAHEGVGFGIGGSVTVDRARNALIGSTNQWSWGGAANTYMNIDHAEGLAFILFTQVTPSFELCQWRRDLTNLIQACLIDSPQSGL